MKGKWAKRGESRRLEIGHILAFQNKIYDNISKVYRSFDRYLVKTRKNMKSRFKTFIPGVQYGMHRVHFVLTWIKGDIPPASYSGRIVCSVVWFNFASHFSFKNKLQLL